MVIFLLLVLVIWFVVIPISKWIFQFGEEDKKWKRAELKEKETMEMEKEIQKDWISYQEGSKPMTLLLESRLWTNIYDLPREERDSSEWAEALKKEGKYKSFSKK